MEARTDYLCASVAKVYNACPLTYAGLSRFKPCTVQTHFIPFSKIGTGWNIESHMCGSTCQVCDIVPWCYMPPSVTGEIMLHIEPSYLLLASVKEAADAS